METITQTTQAQQVLDKVKETYGFVPNLYTEFTGHSPAVAEIYLSANRLLKGMSLTGQEQQTIMLAISTNNECHYCKAAHSKAARMMGVLPEDIEAITSGDLPSDPRLRSLLAATQRLLDKRGWLTDTDLAELEVLGIDRGQVYEIVALIGIMTMSNFVNHIADTEIDSQFS